MDTDHRSLAEWRVRDQAGLVATVLWLGVLDCPPQWATEMKVSRDPRGPQRCVQGLTKQHLFRGWGTNIHQKENGQIVSCVCLCNRILYSLYRKVPHSDLYALTPTHLKRTKPNSQVKSSFTRHRQLQNGLAHAGALRMGWPTPGLYDVTVVTGVHIALMCHV